MPCCLSDYVNVFLVGLIFWFLAFGLFQVKVQIVSNFNDGLSFFVFVFGLST